MPATAFRTELPARDRSFLERFPNTVYCYIPDAGDGPVIHSSELDLTRQGQGYGTFFSVNGFRDAKRTGENLTNINAFFCDIDYPDKIGKTPEKLREYKNDLLMEMMDGSKPMPTAIVETKNGFHAYWILEAPILLADLNPEQQEEIRRQYVLIEESILKHFGGDPAAKDIARVLRVPSTLHQKDPKDPMEVKLSQFAPHEALYSFAEIREAFLKKAAPDGWAVAQGENAISEEVKEEIEKTFPRLARDSYKKLMSKEPGTVPEGLRNKALLVTAYAMKESGWPYEKTLAHFNEFHGLSVREIQKTIRSAYEHAYDFGYNNEVMQAVVTPEERVELSQVTSKVLSKATKEKRASSNNEQKERFATYEMVIADRYPNLIYKWRGDFYDYIGGVYRPLQTEEVRSVFISEMLKDGLTNYRKVSAVNDKIACFKSLDGRTFHDHQENPDPNIINLANGLLDISSYTLREHTPAYLSTSQIPIPYQQGARAPQWERFIDEVSGGDKDQSILLQQIAGYCLTTDMSFAKAFIFFGMGANGKSLFTRILSRIVGRESVSSLSLTTITRQFGLTGLVGKKLNIIDEISGNYFESNVIKGLISGERMSAEVKFRPEPLEFTPTAKLVFSVNELPKINDTTPGLYRRFIIVPFDRSFAENPDLDLERKLSAELPGILNWAIEGLKLLRSEGRFNETARNLEAMRIFRTENSPLAEFLSTEYEPAPEGEERLYAVPVRDLYRQYRQYCFDHGYKPKALANFGREIGHGRVEGFALSRVTDGRSQVVQGLRRVSAPGGEDIVYPQPYHGNQ
jgi:putative DNA primase/helicase